MFAMMQCMLCQQWRPTGTNLVVEKHARVCQHTGIPMDHVYMHFSSHYSQGGFCAFLMGPRCGCSQPWLSYVIVLMLYCTKQEVVRSLSLKMHALAYCLHTSFEGSCSVQILGALSFELTVPTAKTFLRRFLKAALPGDMPADARLECLSSYLTELMLPEYRALQFLPSQVGWKRLTAELQCLFVSACCKMTAVACVVNRLGPSTQCPHATCVKFGQRQLVQLACTDVIPHLV